MFVTLARQTLRVVTLLCCAAQALAMQLDRTRLVITQAEGRAIIQAHSEDSLPMLLQVWVDNDQTAQPGASFITDPPVMRLDPGKSRAIQVWLTQPPDTLPAERESLYWLNVLQVPATTSGEASASNHRLYVSVQTRLKIFYRPRALAHYDAAALASGDQLRFTLERDAAGLAWLRIHNPAPIHQSLATLTLHLPAPNTAAVALDAPMLAPFEEQRLALPKAAAHMGLHDRETARIAFSTIDDDGNVIEDEQLLPSANTSREQRP